LIIFAAFLWNFVLLSFFLFNYLLGQLHRKKY
jgi:hypothetical protein